MKHLNLFKKGAFLLTMAFLLASGISKAAYAANDDPGAGRLSGDYISDDFYDTDSNSTSSLFLRRYGSSTTTNPYTGLTYSHHSTFDDRTIINGIDVSFYQKDIDWNKVKADGIDFAFIRVGYRGYGSSGTLNASTKDTYYDTNMKNAIAAGVKVGIYVFSQAITEKEAKEEAQYILDYIGSYDVSMPLVLDYEYAPTGTSGRLYNAKLSKAAATKVCLAFCDTIAKAGYAPAVYANKSMLEGSLNASDITDKGYRIWLANYTTSTTYGKDFDFWQYASNGKVDGIKGNVDMNFYYAKDADDFTTNGTKIATSSFSAIPNQAYTGNYVMPKVTVTNNGTVLTEDVDYVISYSNNKNIGTATIKITGKGTFCGTKTLTFKIVPKTMTGLKASKRSTTYITLKWTKNTTGTGYQIYRSTSLNGTYKKIKTISKNTTTTYKNTKLTKGQCYYYKIRSYKKVGSTTYYGAFSDIKALYTNMGYTRNLLTKSGATLYTQADTSANVLVSPAVGTSLSVSYATKDASGNTWYYVKGKVNGTSYTGFIRSNRATITKVGKVNASNVNVRKSYSIKSKKLTALKRNKKVTVLSTKKKKGVTWYKVTFKKGSKTYNGWISAPYIKIV